MFPVKIQASLRFHLLCSDPPSKYSDGMHLTLTTGLYNTYEDKMGH